MKKLREHKGAAAVEFAIVLLPLIILVFGAIEFGVLLYNQQVITNASREGARAGIVAAACKRIGLEDDSISCMGETVNRTGIKTYVDNYSKSHLITFGATSIPLTTTIPEDPASADLDFGDGSTLTVTVTYDYSFLLIPNFIPGIQNPRTLTATTVMKYE